LRLAATRPMARVARDPRPTRANDRLRSSLSPQVVQAVPHIDVKHWRGCRGPANGLGHLTPPPMLVDRLGGNRRRLHRQRCPFLSATTQQGIVQPPPDALTPVSLMDREVEQQKGPPRPLLG